MNKIKKFLSTFMAVVLTFSVVQGFSLKQVKADPQDEFTIESGSVKNGEFIINFNESRADDLDLNNFSAVYKINNENKGSLTLKTIERVESSDIRFKFTYDKLEAASSRQDVDITVYFDYKEGSATSRNFTFSIDAETIEEYTIKDIKNGSFVMVFKKSKKEISLADFTTKLYIDGKDKGSIDFSYYSVPINTTDTFEIAYRKIEPTSSPQSIKIELAYKKVSKGTIEYVLYSNGDITESLIGAEYEDREKSSFKIEKIQNGEINVLFDNKLNKVLTESDFNGEYYINGKKTGNITVRGVDESPNFNGKNYIVYYDKIDATDKSQNVTVLLFYTPENSKKPPQMTYVIDADATAYGVNLSISSVTNFKDSVTLPKIIIAEKGKNTIFPSSSSDVQYVKLELPANFKWEKFENIKLQGSGDLSGITVQSVKYGTSKGEQATNILLVAFTGTTADRKAKAIVELTGLSFRALEEAQDGDVKLSVSGGGIPYEQLTVAKLDTELKPVTPPTTTKTIVSIGLGNKFFTVNGTRVDLETPAFAIDNRTMLPIRFIANAFGVPKDDVIWNNEERTVRIIKDGIDVDMKLGSDIMYVNGVAQKMTTSADAFDNRTFIPIRDLGNALNVGVGWDELARTATLTSK